MRFDNGIGANDSDPDDNEGSESDDHEEHASDNDFGICDEEMDTDSIGWQMHLIITTSKFQMMTWGRT
jgi:hypothetical protein